MGKKLSGRSTQPIGGNVLYGMDDEILRRIAFFLYLDGSSLMVLCKVTKTIHEDMIQSMIN
jgi:hypothetical protein